MNLNRNLIALTLLIILLVYKTGHSQTYQFGNGVTDVNGNTYSTVIYGNGQEWMGENLKSTSFSNGDPIPNITNANQWYTLSSPAYSIYNNNATTGQTYGKLYNYYVVSDNRGICPNGWRVPSKQAFDSLINYLGGSQIAGGRMKESGTNHWNSPNTGATNQSLFNALPNGLKMETGTFQDLGNILYLWSSFSDNPNSAIRLNLFYNDATANTLYGANKNAGLGIRCLRNNFVGLSEISIKSNFSIYPNPAKSTINIKADTKLIGENYIIYDNLGKSVLSGKITSENTSVELGNLSAGIYLFSIGENIKQTFKVVKE
jgi:uncharacterized protein (TIGR02145 family)